MRVIIQSKNLKGESSKSARKTAKVKHNRRLMMSLHWLIIFISALVYAPFIRHFCSVCGFVFHFVCMNLNSAVFH